MIKHIRINTYLRNKGIASRREADELITKGKVMVNGKRASLGMLVGDEDRITLSDGWQTKKQYLAYFKPVGLSMQGGKEGEGVVELWRKQDLFPIGRLDKESEGLLILTNDGRITDALLGDRFEKEYVVEMREKIRAGIPAILKKGMSTKVLGTLRPAESSIEGERTMRIVLHEGKRHQIRVMLSELGMTVLRLKRVRIGTIRLEKLAAGQSKSLRDGEVSSFFI